MTSRCARYALLVCLLLVPVWANAGDDTLGQAYAAILRGDYDGGRATVEHILQAGSDANAQRVRDWLESYHEAVARRNELKAQTFNWNVQNAKKVLEKVAQAKKPLEGNELFLALSFTAKAVPYAADPDALANADWVRGLLERCQAEAARLEQADRHTDALSYYVLMSRVAPDNKEYEKLVKQATRYARVEVTYKDEESMRERIRGVKKGMLQDAAKMIEHLYYKEPDFQDMADGAIDNLLALCSVHKLRDYLDGLGNPALRNHFVRELEKLRAAARTDDGYNRKDLLRLFNQISIANVESVELPQELLIVEFVEGAISRMDDYTGMIWPADAVDFEKMMMGGFEGVGIQLGIDELTSRLKVVTPLENSPALEAGIQPDDVIVAVDGESTAGWTTNDAVKNIMGPAGTSVVLTIRRPGTGETIPFKLYRRRIVLTTVRGLERVPGDANAWNYMLDQDAGVAFIRLSGFHPDSAQELRHALHEATLQGMKGLVLDVRHNPGGLLDVAIDIVSAFLEKGDVVSTRGRLDFERREPVAGRAAYKDLPLVVLVNEGSASASEILAGALQDHHRAIILGDRTFGKGSVQHVRPLDRDVQARLKLTTALYYLPSGRSPHKTPGAETWGITPDWELKLTPKEFRRILERERDSYVIHNESPDQQSKALSDEEREKNLASLKADEAEDEEDHPPLLSEADIKLLDSDPNEAPKTDPQLETALLLIRVKLAADIPWPPELAAAMKKPQGQE